MNNRTYALSPALSIGLILHDAPKHPLRQQFDDVYQLFLHKLTSITYYPHISKAEEETLRSLFNELLELRTFLEEQSKLYPFESKRTTSE